MILSKAMNRQRSHAVLDALRERERQGTGEDVLETNQAHFEFAVGPNNTLRLAQSRTGRQQIDNRTARPFSTVLPARLLRPTTDPKFLSECREVFRIQRHDEIDVPREPSDIDEAKKSSRADDCNIRCELFGNPMQMGKIL